MDNATHTLFALTLARTPLGRAGRGATAALVLSSNAPDIDIVATLSGAEQYLRWHRGPTHGPLGILGLAMVVGVLVWIGRRVFGREPDLSADAPLRMLVALSAIGVLCHVLMDLPTSYGTRLLSPFDWHWFGADWMPIIDIYLLFAMVAGLLFGQRSPHARRRNAAIVLALMACNYGLRGVAHQQALAAAPQLFGPLLPPPCDPARPPVAARLIDSWPEALSATPREPNKRCMVEIVAIPTFFSPFKWRVIAHLSNAYELHDVDLLDQRLRRPAGMADGSWRTTVRVPDVWSPPVFAAASTRLARTFLGFARLPAARSFVDPGGMATVRWNDMRFFGGTTLGPPRNDPFTVVIRIAPDGHIAEQRLGP